MKAIPGVLLAAALLAHLTPASADLPSRHRQSEVTPTQTRVSPP